MPNGGSDCCMNCAYNVAVQKLGRLSFDSGDPNNDEKQKEWRVLSACSLRKIRVNNIMGTFCANCRPAEEEAIHCEIEGPVYASGYHEESWTYPRIPWHGENEVFQVSRELFEGNVPLCDLCDRELEKGLLVMVSDDKAVAFCCNSHYMRWWFERHPDEKVAFDFSRLYDPDAV